MVLVRVTEHYYPAIASGQINPRILISRRRIHHDDEPFKKHHNHSVHPKETVTKKNAHKAFLTNSATSPISFAFNFGNGLFSVIVHTVFSPTNTSNVPAPASRVISNWPFSSSFNLLATRTNACHIFDTDALTDVEEEAPTPPPFFAACFFTDDDGFFVLVVLFEDDDVFFAAMVQHKVFCGEKSEENCAVVQSSKCESKKESLDDDDAMQL